MGKGCLRSPDAGFGATAPRVLAGVKGTAESPRSGGPRQPRVSPHLFPRERPGRARSAGAKGGEPLGAGAAGEGGARTYHALLRLDEGPAEAVHLAVEPAGVAQVVAGAVPPPQRRLDGAAVHALAALGQVLQQVCGESGDERPGEAAQLPPVPGLPGRPPAPLAPALATCCPPPRPRPSPRVFLLSSHARSRPLSLSILCPILLQPWAGPVKPQESSRTWCWRPSPNHLPSVSKDLGVEMRCGEVGLGPLTPPFRLFPSVSKLKSIIITVCHLPNRANHTVLTLITDPCTKPTNILGHSWATLLLLSQVIFKVFTVSVRPLPFL